ncbi:hypothetical protein, partial [Vibrio parahaemolyticus]|uniref:hypothetical protein n=1 Tax=Vibrio parahaemolyticus TaxID=670 RepID=UPI00389284BD
GTWEKYKSSRAQAVQFCQLLTDARFAGRRWYGYINETDLNRFYTDNYIARSFDGDVLPTPIFNDTYNIVGDPQPYDIDFFKNGGEYGFCGGTPEGRGCYRKGIRYNWQHMFYSEVSKDKFNVDDPDSNPLPGNYLRSMDYVMENGAVTRIDPIGEDTSEIWHYIINNWTCISMPDDVLPIR